MSYQVLARKWRPRRFSELVGQEHVVRALQNALEGNRLHHAYLFTGTRGIGKTTIARIFAKSLNCERGQSADPCGECATCVALDEGRFVDLIEIDAASNTGVDDVRDLIENAQYAPASGRFKVYLIDEVHMLSKAAFNALLKTLEEPPPHVKFLLATTDPDKLLVTVLSRCLKFHLKRLMPKQIVEQMRAVLAAEQISFEDGALAAIAQAADGSMRDGLSLLDQAIAHGGGSVADEATRAMLGTIDRGGVVGLLTALADGDGKSLLTEVRRIAGFSPDFVAVLNQFAGLLHQVQLAQLVAEIQVEDAGFDQAEIAELARRLAPEEVQLYYQMATHGQREIELAPDPASGFEMVLLRMLAFRPGTSLPPSAAPDPEAAPVPPRRATSATKPADRPTAAPDNAGKRPAPKASQSGGQVQAAPSVSPPSGPKDWDRLIGEAGLRGPAGQLARHAVLESMEGDRWTLAVTPENQALASGPFVDKLAADLSQAIGFKVRLEIAVRKHNTETPADRLAAADSNRQSEAEQAIRNDPMVRELEDALGARVIPQSIQPLENRS